MYIQNYILSGNYEAQTDVTLLVYKEGKNLFIYKCDTPLIGILTFSRPLGVFVALYIKPTESGIK